jgi:hypothetical protein
MRLLPCAIILALACFASAVFADEPQFADGHYLLERCTSKDNVEVGYCLGYVAGAGDAYNDQGIRRNCLNLGAPQGAAFKAVVSYLQNNPDKLSWSASALVSLALAQAFPCH